MSKLGIAYLSDIHLEFGSVMPEVPTTDVIILAGDIHTPLSTANNVLRKYCHATKLVSVRGNHEYYGGDASAVEPRVSTADWNTNVSIVSCTLWTDPPADNRPTLNDFEAIKGFTPERMREVHEREKHLLQKRIRYEIMYGQAESVVVVTHHLPSFLCIAPEYMTSGNFRMNQFFASNTLEDIWEPEWEGKVKAWIFGHTHSKVNMIHPDFGVRMLCNPHGYFKFEHRKQKPEWAYLTV